MFAIHTVANQASYPAPEPPHQQPEIGDENTAQGDVVAEAVFAREQVEELPLRHLPPRSRLRRSHKSRYNCCTHSLARDTST